VTSLPEPLPAAAIDELPDDVGQLKMMVLAERARAERYEHILKLISRTTFGKRSEKLPADQLALGLEDQGIALAEAEGLMSSRSRWRKAWQGGADVVNLALRAARCQSIFRASKS
jgi:hypothetical protein